MHLLAALLISTLILHCCPASIPAVTDYNPYMYSQTYYCSIQAGSPSTDYFEAFYITSFPNTVNVASQVFYSTQSLYANIVDYPFIYNNNNANLEYYLDLDTLTINYMITKIEGYLVTPLYDLFSFRYLLVSRDAPWLDTYMTIQTVTFPQGYYSIDINMPTDVSSLTVCVLLRDIKFEFERFYFQNTGDDFYINWFWYDYNPILTLYISTPAQFSTVYNNQLRYTVIIMNTAGISKDYPGYVFTAEMGYYDSYSYYFPSIFNVAPQHPSLFFGLSLFYMKMPINDPSLAFQTYYSSNRIQIYISTSSNDFAYYSFHAAFTYYVCKNSLYPIFDPTTLTCTTVTCAATLQYYNHTTKSCLPCRFDCMTCNSSLQCLSCDPLYRSLSTNFTCVPLPGYYESNSYVPFGCNTVCSTCTDGIYCTSCQPDYQIFSNNTCLSCGIYFSSACKVCNQTACLSCLTGYRLVNTTFCNLPCTDASCSICDNANTATCFLCRDNYMLDASSKCVFIEPPTPSVCGNGKKETGEQCDDANLWPWDGCDPNCQQEPDYNCHDFLTQVANYTTHCAYTKSIDFFPISIEKLDYGNKITIIMSVKQYQHKFWTSRMALGYYFIVTPIPFKNMQVHLIQGSYYSGTIAKLAPLATAPYIPNSLFSVTFEYLQHIHGQTVNLCFDFSSSNDLVLTEIPAACQSLTIIPDNNKYANLYTDTLYQQEKLVYNVCLLIAVASFGMFLVSLLIGGKRIAVELVIVIQITYVGLITVPKLTPIFAALTALSTVNNGYNILYSNAIRPFEDTLADQRCKGAEMYSQFLYNLNTGLLFVIFPVLIGIIAVIISKVRDTSPQKGAKIKRFYEFALGEYTFVGLAFCGCISGASTVLQIQYGMKDLATMGGMLSLVVCALLLMFYLLGGILRVKRGEWFYEYAAFLVKNTFSLGFQVICYFFWMISGALLCFFNTFKYINAFIMGTFLLLYLITLTRPIFNRPLDRYRTQLNLLTISFCQLPYLYANTHSVPQNSEDNSLSMMAPTAIVFLLIINFLTNLAYFIYQAIKKLRAYLAANNGKNLQQYFQDKQKEIAQQQKLQAKILTAIRKLQEGFISITEKDQGQVPMSLSVKRSVQAIQRDNSKDGIEMTATNINKTALLQGDYIHANFENIAQL